jgi:hypothetical protein
MNPFTVDELKEMVRLCAALPSEELSPGLRHKLAQVQAGQSMKTGFSNARVGEVFKLTQPLHMTIDSPTNRGN